MNYRYALLLRYDSHQPDIYYRLIRFTPEAYKEYLGAKHWTTLPPTLDCQECDLGGGLTWAKADFREMLDSGDLEYFNASKSEMMVLLAAEYLQGCGKDLAVRALTYEK